MIGINILGGILFSMQVFKIAEGVSGGFEMVNVCANALTFV